MAKHHKKPVYVLASVDIELQKNGWWTNVGLVGDNLATSKGPKTPLCLRNVGQRSGFMVPNNLL